MGNRAKCLLLAVFAAFFAVSGFANAAAPQPVVQGNRIVDSVTSRQFIPRGVNFPGFEYACQQGWGYGNAGTQPAEVASTVAAIASWRINTVRLPLNQDCWLGDDGLPAGDLTMEGYRNSVEAFTGALGAAGIVTVLDLHWTGPDGLVADGLRPMPDDRSPAFWQSVASRFKSNRSVIFDLFNEPHSRWNPDDSSVFTLTWDCWSKGGCQAPSEIDTAPKSGLAWYQATGLSTLVATVRAAGATQPIMLSGIDYANDLRGWRAHAPSDAQLIASFHNYPKQRCHTVSCWDGEIAPLAERVPVLAGELGQNDCAAPDHVDRFMTWADQHSIGYLAWAWWALPDLGCTNFALVSDLDGTPLAPVGTLFREHLADLARGPEEAGPAPDNPNLDKAGKPGTAPREIDPVNRHPSGLRVRQLRWKKPRLTLKIRVSPIVSFGVSVKVKVNGGPAIRRLVQIRGGRGRLAVRIPGGRAPRLVVVSYPGDQRLRPMVKRLRPSVSKVTRGRRGA